MQIKFILSIMMMTDEWWWWWDDMHFQVKAVKKIIIQPD